MGNAWNIGQEPQVWGQKVAKGLSAVTDRPFKGWQQQLQAKSNSHSRTQGMLRSERANNVVGLFLPHFGLCASSSCCCSFLKSLRWYNATIGFFDPDGHALRFHFFPTCLCHRSRSVTILSLCHSAGQPLSNTLP